MHSSPRAASPPLRLVRDGAPPPASIESERAVLGSILLNREAITAVAPWLAPEDFYSARHGQIYAAALACYQQQIPPDTRTVFEELRRRGQAEDVGGVAGLVALVDAVPTSYHIEYYAQTVVDLAWVRASQAAANRAVGALYDDRLSVGERLTAVEALLSDMRARLRHGSQQVRGRHISELWSQEFAPLTWIVPDILPAGHTLFSGKPKLGKSLIGIGIAAAVASGGVALGSVPVDAGDVLYLCLEDPTRALQHRLETVLQGRPDIRLWYETEWPRLDAGGVAQIETWLAAHPEARLVVIDTVAKVQPTVDARSRKSAYQEDYDALAGLTALSHRCDVAILSITHSRKADASDVLDEVSGTSGRTGSVDNVWVHRRVRGESTADLAVELREAPGSTRALTFDGTLGLWRLGGDAGEARQTQLRTRLLEALADTPAWPKDLAELLEAPPAKVRQQLGVLKHQGLITIGSRDRYEITESGKRLIDLRSDDDSGDRTDRTDRSDRTDRRSDLTGVATGAISDHSDHSDQCDHSDHADAHDPLDALLTPAPPRERFYIRMYLRSMKASDQERARAKCQTYGIDYPAAYRLLHHTEPPDSAE